MKQQSHGEIPLEQLLARTGSLYKLVIAASERARELSDGAPSLIAHPSPKPGMTALYEALEGKISYRLKAQAKGATK